MPDTRAAGIIPARFGSTRFPGKPLAMIAGMPMIQHVYERAVKARLLDPVIVATDDARIAEAVKAFGGRSVMTSPDHRSGTDRVAEVMHEIGAPYCVNIQGDEPLIDPGDIDTCASIVLRGHPMCTLAARIRERSELFDQNVVKVVIDAAGDALMFSRSAIPFPRKYLDKGEDVDLDSSVYLRQIGIYGYSAATLKRLEEAAECETENLECLEQIRALWLGIKVRVGVVDSYGPCVDRPEDIERILEAMGPKDGT
jgi:3-deoxy-manno-octulosonate cytidylyltransferase (CMP-KDO synthetase)